MFLDSAATLSPAYCTILQRGALTVFRRRDARPVHDARMGLRSGVRVGQHQRGALAREVAFAEAEKKSTFNETLNKQRKATINKLVSISNQQKSYSFEISTFTSSGVKRFTNRIQNVFFL